MSAEYRPMKGTDYSAAPTKRGTKTILSANQQEFFSIPILSFWLEAIDADITSQLFYWKDRIGQNVFKYSQAGFKPAKGEVDGYPAITFAASSINIAKDLIPLGEYTIGYVIKPAALASQFLLRGNGSGTFRLSLQSNSRLINVDNSGGVNKQSASGYIASKRQLITASWNPDDDKVSYMINGTLLSQVTETLPPANTGPLTVIGGADLNQTNPATGTSFFRIFMLAADIAKASNAGLLAQVNRINTEDFALPAP